MSELSIKREHNVKEEKRGSGGRMTTESIDQSTTSAAERPKVILPRQLESVPKTTEFPSERHRWNTNEEVAAILIAFDKHKEWQNKEVRQRPPSGSMLLYSRKMGRYRKDGYCWKKRKDGKTTREDHMKLKVQGVECIYGCYVHSAILPTFHRRCYWLLQNPDIVLVHYLNVPYNDDNKLSIPTLSHCTEKKEWTKEELTNQLRPMFTSASQLASSNVTKQMTDDTVESIVQQLLEHQKKRQEEQECTCNGSGSCDKPSCKAAKCQMISPKSEPQTTAIPQNHLMTLVNTRRQGDRGLTTGSTNVIINSTSQGTNRQMAPTGPLILNLSQLHGSNGVIILSSQAPAPISIINSVATATATATQVTSTKPIQTHHAQGQVPGQGQGDIQGQTADFSDVKREEGIASCDIPKTDILVQGQAPNLSSPNGQCVSHPHVGGPSTQMTSGGAAEVGHNSQEQQEVSMDTSQQVEPLPSDSTAILPEQKSPMVEDLVAELNMKNELHNFDQGLQLSQEEIQKTLSANLPSNSQLSQNGLANQNNGSIDSMEAMRTSMVSPQSTDLNFDAFDIFSFPDFDGENLNSDMTHSHNSCTSTSTLTHSTASTTPAAAISCASCLSNQKGHDIKNEPRAGIANITDFSPEWAYPEGGVKVLVTGPWYSTTSPYTVLFDNVRVPASLVQSGVLRCFCPTHEPGLVTLQVACEGYVISNSCVFEYKSKETTVPGKQQQWFQIEDDHLKLAILERLEEIEKRLTPSQASLALKGDIRNNKSGGTHSVFEDRLIECCDHLSHMTWVKGSDLIRSPCRMTLLHLAAALGYSRLISHLVKWRTENPSLVLEYEVDGLSIDDQACTPLMWACARGQQEAAILLYQWNANALNVCNKDGLLPAMAAQNNGHFELVQRLQQTEIACATHLKSGEIEATQPPQEDATAQDSGTFRVDSPMQNIGSPITQPQSPETFPRSPVPVNLQDFSLPAQTDLRANSPPQNWSNMDLTIEIPPPPPYPGDSKWMKTKDGSFVPPRQSTPVKTKSGATARRQKLLKRISVEVLPDFPQTNIEGEKQGEDSPEVRNNESLSLLHGSEVKGHGMRAVSSDPHLSSTMNPILFEDNPMISVTDPDPNSLMMFMQTDSQQLDLGLCMDDSHIDHVAMETDSPRSTSPYIDVEKLSSDEDDMKQSPGSAVEEATQNQMVTLAKQIIAAMPERIKLSPGRGEEPSVEDIVDVRRSRSSSHSSFSSYSSSTTPPYAEDSGISTPLGDGLAFEEYRYADLGTPASSLSPASTCLQSPYSFNLDSPPATTADFIEYFNAPNIFMEKDFSQLTLSDSEQRKLYEAAKVIQSCYRLYKDKKQQQQQRQKEIEAAVLIQSYYRRYKQYAYYKKMTQAAVLIQSQFRSYSAQKRFKRRREAATVIQNQYRTYKEHERFKKSRNAAVIIQQKFRSHYQRKRSQEMARKMHQLVRQSSHSSEPSDIATAEGAQTTEAESQMRRKSADTLHPIPSQSDDQS